MSIAELPPKPDVEQRKGISFGFYYPRTVLGNADMALWGVETAGGHPLTADSILQKTGVRPRFIAGTDETHFFMGGVAALHALENGNVRKPVDFIFVTTTYGTGKNLSDEINTYLHLNAQGLDVYEACTGFAGTLSHIKQNEGQYLGKSILIVSVDKHQEYVFDLKNGGAKNDPALSQTIFSDGASAIRFIYGEDLTVLASTEVELGLGDSLKLDDQRALRVAPFIAKPASGIPLSESGKIEQQGKTVYGAVTRAVPELIAQTVRNAGLEPDNIDLVIPHQASIHVLETLQARLKDYPDKVFIDIENGNFSSASIPRAMREAMRQSMILKGDTAVLAGFGAGLFAAVAVVKF